MNNRWSVLGWIAAVSLLMAMGCASLCPYPGNARPRNIILMIGDGMGVGQITAAGVVKSPLSLQSLDTIGLVTTYSHNALVTDSAAAATALATGHKTNNDWLSVSPEKQPLTTVLETAERQGKKTGLVVTCTIPHATPAAFYAHSEDRNQYNRIAGQFVSSGIDVALGGGWQFFIPRSTLGSKRDDDRDLIADLKHNGYNVIMDYAELKTVDRSQPLVGLFAPDALERVSKRGPMLPDMVRTALECLSGHPRGFFLMVEGSQIDWACHENNPTDCLGETADFDDAVGVAWAYAQHHPDTLLIVTADHETGGTAVLEGSLQKKEVTRLGFSTSGHSANMVLLFAWGPGAKAFAGIQDNADVGRKIMDCIR